jgi:hypothetical protein
LTNETKEEGESKRSRVLVRMGEFQVELEGTHADVTALMGKPVYDFISGLQKVAWEVPPAKVTEEEAAPPTEYPPPLGKTASLGDALKKLMVDTNWGKQPRSFGEIMTALKTSGIYYDKGVLAGTLNYMIKKGTLRRLGTRGNFKYVAA